MPERPESALVVSLRIRKAQRRSDDQTRRNARIPQSLLSRSISQACVALCVRLYHRSAPLLAFHLISLECSLCADLWYRMCLHRLYRLFHFFRRCSWDRTADLLPAPALDFVSCSFRSCSSVFIFWHSSAIKMPPHQRQLIRGRGITLTRRFHSFQRKNLTKIIRFGD